MPKTTYTGDLKTAIDSYQSQLQADTKNSPSIRQIARDHDVCHVTLYKRINNLSSSRTTAFQHLQALTPNEEQSLVDWIDRMLLSGHPPAIKLVKETANQLRFDRLVLEDPATDSRQCLGQNWLDGFSI